MKKRATKSAGPALPGANTVRHWQFSWPILIFHGQRDKVIPHSHGVALQRAARRAKLVSYDCDHNDMERAPSGYWAEIERYLQTIGVTRH